MKTKFILVTIFTLAANAVFSQDGLKRLWLSGNARNVMYSDNFSGRGVKDTITTPRLNSGHTLVDLALNAQPNPNTYIHGMVRIRNDYGGFWGAGITFDVRQLYLKGIIANSIRYQIGDINYKLTPYTMINPHDDFESIFLDYDNLYKDLLDYDLFFDFDNAWRQQGGAIDFALQFKKYISEVKFNAFISRQNPSNFNNISDRLFAGGNITLVQSKYLEAGINFIEMFDLVGTALDSTALSNPVVTAQYAINLNTENLDYGLLGEFGNSTTKWNNDAAAPEWNDYFFDLGAKLKYKPIPIAVQLNYKNTGPQFLSPGAQTRRINFNANPAAYSRIGNNAQLRPIGMMDVLRDASIYQTTISTTLQAFNPSYGNALPFGDATPNRQGFISTAQFQDKNNFLNIEGKTAILTEVVGQGTANLREFQVINLKTAFHVNNWIKAYKKSLILSVSYWSEQTSRAGAENFEKISLNNESFDLSLDAQFMEKGYVLLGYRLLNSQGNELVTERNSYMEILNYSQLSINLSEQLILSGLRFEFSEKNTLSLIYSNYNSGFKSNQLIDYNLNGFAVIYNLKF